MRLSEVVCKDNHPEIKPMPPALKKCADVPRLETALTGPLGPIESQLLESKPVIEDWFQTRWQETPPPFYASVDLRNAGFKIAPVDTNLFPAGFNNLNPAFLPLCSQAVHSRIEQLKYGIRRILLVPESHTRNLSYLENVAVLKAIIENAGFEVRLGSLIPDLKTPLDIALPSGRSVKLEPLVRQQDRVGVADFDPDLAILNNDLSSGIPAILEGLAQPLVPPLAMGWSTRRKSLHFTHYQRVAAEFSAHLGIDPWRIDPLFRDCGEIDFMKRSGEECLVHNVEVLLAAIQRKYDAYGITSKPLVFVKADAGTYGMGVMTAYSAEEVKELNRKQRTQMATTKEGQKVTRVIIQEGVYTHETWDEAVAEPVVYLIGPCVVGGFYRVHMDKAADENLNAPGMRFEPLSFAELPTFSGREESLSTVPDRFYAYGVIARLGLLAAAREIAGLTLA
jgi:glutamate--cysteine ligase